MEYGTIKSEVWAHNAGVAQEYYRYEVITRWWKTDEPDPAGNNARGFDKIITRWQHTIIRISREGDVSHISDDAWFAYYKNYIAKQPLSSEGMHYNDVRAAIAEQHRFIVRHCIA